MKEFLYWRINVTRNITINRDDKWFQDNLEKFRSAWTYVECLRTDPIKAKLLKRYLNVFPRDAENKIKEKPKGIIMETIEKICNEPKGDLLSKRKEKFMKNLLLN